MGDDQQKLKVASHESTKPPPIHNLHNHSERNKKGPDRQSPPKTQGKESSDDYE